MSQVPQLIAVIKKALRQHGLTYAGVARGLGVSESSVKRMFSRGRLSLERVERVCELMHLDLVDVVELARAAESRLTELGEAEERALVSDLKLMLVALLAINHWTAAEMGANYALSEAELNRLLVRLDRMAIIELLPGNRIKVKLARTFRWRTGGPIQRFFEERVQRQYFQCSFLGPNELRLMLNGSLSDKSIGILQQRMKRLAEEFDSLVEEDLGLDHRSRDGTTMVLAIRPWEMAEFGDLRRRKPEAPRRAGRRP